MTIDAKEVLFFVYAVAFILAVWPRAAKDASRVLYLHGTAMPKLYAGIVQGLGDYFAYMGWRRRRAQTMLRFDVSEEMRQADERALDRR